MVVRDTDIMHRDAIRRKDAEIDRLTVALATARNDTLEEAKNIANRQALIFQHRGDEEDRDDYRVAAEALRTAAISIDKRKEQKP